MRASPTVERYQASECGKRNIGKPMGTYFAGLCDPPVNEDDGDHEYRLPEIRGNPRMQRGARKRIVRVEPHDPRMHGPYAEARESLGEKQ